LKYIKIFDEIGWECVNELRESFGGLRLYIGKKKDGELFRRLVAVIGEDRAEILRAELGGTWLSYPPRVMSNSFRGVAERIELKQLYESGVHINDLAEWCERDRELIKRIVGLRKWEFAYFEKEHLSPLLPVWQRLPGVMPLSADWLVERFPNLLGNRDMANLLISSKTEMMLFTYSLHANFMLVDFSTREFGGKTMTCLSVYDMANTGHRIVRMFEQEIIYLRRKKESFRLHRERSQYRMPSFATICTICGDWLKTADTNTVPLLNGTCVHSECREEWQHGGNDNGADVVCITKKGRNEQKSIATKGF